MFHELMNVTLAHDDHFYDRYIYMDPKPHGNWGAEPYLESSLAGHIGLSLGYGSQECLLE